MFNHKTITEMNKNKTKWRGIPTSQMPKFEEKAKTITNRYGQKSLSLPRIDDKKRWAGFAGNTGISRKVAQLIPKCNVYCEPCAGTAKVWQELKKKPKYKYAILNDKSKFIVKWLRKEFKEKDLLIHNYDFNTLIPKIDGKDVVFMIDLPWYKGFYDQIFACFDRPDVKYYNEELLEILENIKGKFIITSAKNNLVMKKSGYHNWYLRSDYVVSGNYPQQLITTNIKFSKAKILKTGLMLLD